MIYLGIDNGLNGGLAYVDENEKLIAVFTMPVIKGKKTEYNIGAIVQNIKSMQDIKKDIVAVLEQAAVRPISGKRASFMTGLCYGIMRGILNALNISCVIVSPNQWMKDILKGTDRKDKKGSIKYCLNKYPDCSFTATERSTKPHDGMTDATCLAIWGVRNIGTKNKPIIKET